MKYTRFLSFLLAFSAVFFFSCDRERETEGVSRVTNFPLLTMAGDQWMSIPVGGTFTDPGATATEGGETITVTTSGQTVDPSTPGVYVITYVGVIAPDAFGADLSGQYKRNAGAFGVATVTKLGPGLYRNNNVGGVAAPSGATTVNFYHTEGTKLVVPVQENSGGTFSAENATYTFAAGGDPAKYTWTVINPGYLNNARTFIKQ
jgi:hypothetical protein